MKQSMMTKEIRESIPSLYEQDGMRYEAVAHVHYFCPWNGWHWYGTEFDGKDTFFGLVIGYEQELGYFSLHELSETKVTVGGTTIRAVERDIHWTPKPLSEVL